MADNLNYIKQIAAGGQTYDIAVAHGLTFKTGTKTQAWDGISDVEVVIPTLADLVQDPIRFAGTVGSDCIAKNNGVEITPAKGDLVYITADCTFGGKTCEAGDMAVYDGSVWNVVSGENQVSIKAGTTPADGATEVEISATAKSVLYVEGKELALKLPTKLLEGIIVNKNANKTISLNDGAIAAVDAKWITLSHTPAAQDTSIGSNKNIDLPSELANGNVTFSGDTSLVKPSDIAKAWQAGTDGSHSSAEVAVTVSGGVTLTKGAGTDFVTSVTPSSDSFVTNALKSASLKVSSTKPASGEDIAVNPVLTTNPTFTNDTTQFATGIITTSTGADFTIPGAVSVSGAFLIKPSSNGVVVDVTIPTLGDASSFTDATYVSATASTGVIASIANPTVTINNGNVISSVSVSGHVLSFGTAEVTATASQGAVTYKKAQYKKTIVTNTPGISYGSIQTAAGTGYKLNKQAVNATLTPGTINYIGVQTTGVSTADKGSALTDITLSKGAYTAALSNVAGTIASGTVVTSVTDAVVPTLSTVGATGTITGSVETTLTTSNVKVGTFTNDTASINIGTWALGESETSVVGGIAVGKSGNAEVTGNITIVSGTYVTDVSAIKLS